MLIELTPDFMRIGMISTGVLHVLTLLGGVIFSLFGKDNGLGEGLLTGSIFPFLMFVFFLVAA